MTRIFVEGTSIGALTCAARLKVKGYEVIVIAKGASIDDAASVVRSDGFVFDLADTSLTVPATFRDLFLKTGAAFEECIDISELDQALSIRWVDGNQVTLPGVGVASTANAIEVQFGSRAADQWRNFLRAGSSLWAEHRLALESVETHDKAVRLRRLFATRRDDYIRLRNRLLGTAHLRDIADSYILKNGVTPSAAHSIGIAEPYVEHTFGISHVKGGMCSLSRAIYERCVELGVIFQFSQSLYDQNLTADDHVVQLTSRRDNFFTLLLALDGTTSGLLHTNIFYVNKDVASSKSHTQNQGHLPEISMFQVCAPQDELMHPPGSENWTVQVPVSMIGFDWTDRDMQEMFSESLLLTLEQFNVNVRERILWIRVIPPKDADIDPLSLTPSVTHFIDTSDYPSNSVAFQAMAATRLAIHIHQQIRESAK